MNTSTSQEKLDLIRMKDINSQLIDIIYLLCDAKQQDSAVLLRQLTNISLPEWECLHLQQ